MNRPMFRNNLITIFTVLTLGMFVKTLLTVVKTVAVITRYPTPGIDCRPLGRLPAG